MQIFSVTYLQFFQLYEKPDESEVATQTDLFLDRPSTPVYCPGKIGQDACTQIEAGDVSIQLFIWNLLSLSSFFNMNIMNHIDQNPQFLIFQQNNSAQTSV